MFSGLTEGVLLIALALGYIVCYLANREEKKLRFLGYLVGVFIIIFCAVTIISNAFFSARMYGAMCKMRKMGCMSKMGMMQHKMMPPPPAAPQAPAK